MNLENIRVKDIRGIIKYEPKSKKWRAKARKDHIVGIQLSGEAYHDFGYESFVLSRNCVYFFNRRDDYNVEVTEPTLSYSVHFTSYEDIDTDSFCIPVGNPDEIIGILQKMETSKGSSNGELTSLSLLYKLLYELVRIREKTYFPKDKRITQAKEYMDLHFREKSCLSEAVARSGLTPRRFCDLFKGIFNTTPNRYIVARKIEHAKELLRAEGVSVTEVSETCGFSDVYYFSKVFKNETGVPPSRWGQENG